MYDIMIFLPKSFYPFSLCFINYHCTTVLKCFYLSSLTILSARLHYKYLLIPDLFTVALPVLPQSGGKGHVLDPRGFSCLHDDNRWHTTLPGHDVRKTQGGPQKRQEHKDLLVEVYHRVWPKTADILSFTPRPWFSRAQNGSPVAHHTIMTVLGFGDTVWQRPKQLKL